MRIRQISFMGYIVYNESAKMTPSQVEYNLVLLSDKLHPQERISLALEAKNTRKGKISPKKGYVQNPTQHNGVNAGTL